MDTHHVPPSYVKNVIIYNYTQHNITILAQFHENLKTYEISPGQSIIAENEINKGTWFSVDPVEKITVQSSWHKQDERFLQSPGGVVTLRFKVENVDGNDYLLELEKDQ